MMDRRVFAAGIAGALASLPLGCSSPLGLGSASSGGGGTMSATVSGQSWSAGISAPGAMAVTGIDQAEPEGNGRILTITGVKTDGTTGTSISIALESSSGFPTGNYTIGPSSHSFADGSGDAQVNWDSGGAYDGMSGTISLTSFSGTHVGGTFAFTATRGSDTLSVTSGKFDANYTNE
jgi:hypothetical protein